MAVSKDVKYALSRILKNYRAIVLKLSRLSLDKSLTFKESKLLNMQMKDIELMVAELRVLSGEWSKSDFCQGIALIDSRMKRQAYWRK